MTTYADRLIPPRKKDSSPSLETLSIRDQFAMKAMFVAAVLIDGETREKLHLDGTFPAKLAKEAYRIADAMMDRRKETP